MLEKFNPLQLFSIYDPKQGRVTMPEAQPQASSPDFAQTASKPSIDLGASKYLLNQGKPDSPLSQIATGDVKGFAKGLATKVNDPIAMASSFSLGLEPESVGGPIKAVVKEEAPKVFKGFKDLTTKVLDALQGRSTVSKQFIEDLTNNAGMKQAERDLIRNAVADEKGVVNVKDFADRVRSELLPLEVKTPKDIPNGFGRMATRYESITLPEELRGPVANYDERIYQSPIKTSAGDVHFGGLSLVEDELPNYFAHTRIEDLPPDLVTKDFKKSGNLSKAYDNFGGEPGATRRVIELQSDLFQKGRLEGEYQNKAMMGIGDLEARADEMKKLEPYRNTWHERVIREEVKQAAVDGKTKLQFPTGETAMKIEGLGGGETRWYHKTGTGLGAFEKVTPDDLKIGKSISDDTVAYGLHDNQSQWIITDVLGDGEFQAIQKGVLDTALNNSDYHTSSLSNLDAIKYFQENGIQQDATSLHRTPLSNFEETFNVSGKVDKENPIYKFYEKEVGKYLKNKYNAEPITDPQGVQWWQLNVPKDKAKLPIEAFGALPFFMTGKKDDKDLKPISTYDPKQGRVTLQ